MGSGRCLRRARAAGRSGSEAEEEGRSIRAFGVWVCSVRARRGRRRGEGCGGKRWPVIRAFAGPPAWPFASLVDISTRPSTTITTHPNKPTSLLDTSQTHNQPHFLTTDLPPSALGMNGSTKPKLDRATSKTMASQTKLPRLPVPKLEDTMKNYLRALEVSLAGSVELGRGGWEQV